MKKTYLTPAALTVALDSRRNVMLNASEEGGSQIIGDGGTGDGSDMGVKEFSSKSIWDNEW